MDLTKYKFPTLTDADIAFSVLKTDPVLLAEAKKRGFYEGDTPYNNLFNALAFKGGVMKYKPGVDPDFKEKASRYLKALRLSFAPRHEDKEAVCAMLLSELFEVEQ